MLNELVRQGITAYKAGDKTTAKRFFLKALDQDRLDIMAWIWLSAVVDTDHERRQCLESVLKIDPRNEIAKKGLQKLNSSLEATRQIQVEDFYNEPPRVTDVTRGTPASTVIPTTPVTPAFTIEPDFVDTGSRPAQNWDIPAAPAQPTPEPVPPEPAAVERAEPGRSRGKSSLPTVLILIVLSILCIVGMYLFLQPYLFPDYPTLGSRSNAGIPAAAQFIPSNTPVVTQAPLLTATPTVTLTPRPTKTLTPTATFPAPNATLAYQMGVIQAQVAELRGLPINRSVPSFLIPSYRAESIFREDIATDDFKQDVTDYQTALVALGLVDPSYDLVTNSINHLVDGLGGFYQPDTKNLFVLGVWFRGMEHFIYSHEFDHALVDMNFDIGPLRADEICRNDSQRCDAVTALIEGDAEFLMYAWLEQYATRQDYRELINWRPALYVIPEESPPPFGGQDIYFPYEQGHIFVQALYDQGGWDGVNRAYRNPPTSTEQILHPEKYLAGENPIPVEDPPLSQALGPDWVEIKKDILGEWMTYLILAYNTDEETQVDPETAAQAAAGWGGDRMQVYSNTQTGDTVLTVRWQWETPTDADEFYQAGYEYLDGRYKGAKLAAYPHDCWQTGQQVSCLVLHIDQTLWMMGPDQQSIEALNTLFPDFRLAQ